MLDTNRKSQEVASALIHSFIHSSIEANVLQSDCLSFSAISKWVNLGNLFNPCVLSFPYL